MSSLAFSLALCTPRKLSTFTSSKLATNLHRTESTANLKVSSSRPEYQLLQLGIPEGPISLSRRQLAVGVGVLSLGLTEGDVLLQTQPFSASAAPCELVLAPSGLAFCDQILGSGSQATEGQLIKAHYIGKLENGKVFDSSYSRGKPLTFRVGVGEVNGGEETAINRTSNCKEVEMAKSLRSKRDKRLRAIRREIVQPFYDKKDAAKQAAQEAALAAPKLPVRSAASQAMDIPASATASTSNNSMDVDMAVGNQSTASLKAVGGVGKKRKFKMDKRRRHGKGKIGRRHI